MRGAITPRTVLLAASAPSYAHGVVDPISEIGRIALETEVLFHVDGCIGAFLLPYFREMGARVTDFDFRVPGVTSISMDFHKYAFAPKGASVILYRNAEIRRHQIFSWTGWPGYTLVNQTMQSSKSGGPLAGTWAVLNYFGQDGYLEEARRLKEATDRIVAGVDAMEELQVLGRPEISLIGIGSDSLSVFRICDEMKKLGWHMYPQTRHGNLRESFHLTVVPGNVDRVDEWLEDLGRCIKGLKSQPLTPETGDLRALVSGIDFETLTDPEIEKILEGAGLAGGSLPQGGAAEINEILNELPPAVTDRILTLYFNQIFRYRPAPGNGG
jgi:glutamate/tyrosine decarboxylase-like PLP-dependent enzyme